jgi:hypothetical protein
VVFVLDAEAMVETTLGVEGGRQEREEIFGYCLFVTQRYRPGLCYPSGRQLGCVVITGVRRAAPDYRENQC